MRLRRTHLLASAALASLALAFAGLATPYVEQVTSVVPGVQPAGDPVLMFGPPVGGGALAGSTDTYTLGQGGQVVVELGARAADGPGTDLVVYENPFFVTGSSTFETWAELATVEVSSNGFDWAGFPTRYLGEPGPFSPFQGLPMWWYRGFAGVSTVAADPVAGADPFDIVEGGGDAFDFADLADHPLVLSGHVDLQEVRFVRLTDVMAGDLDSQGVAIVDCGDAILSSADIDAVLATNTSVTPVIGRPWVELSIETIGTNDWLILEMGDPNGLWQVIPEIKCSNNGLEVDFFNLLQYFVILESDGLHVRLAAGPVVSFIPPTLMKVSVHDGLGGRAGDAIYFP